jgi:hypothetical protein
LYILLINRLCIYYLSVDFGDNSFFEQIFLNGPVPQGDPEGELEGIQGKIYKVW